MNLAPSHTSSPAYRLFIRGGLIFVLGKILVGICGRDIVWGLHHWAFYSPSTQFAALLTTLLLLILAYHRAGYSTILGLFNRCRLPQTAAVAAVLASFPLFYLLRVRHLLLGDASLLVSQLRQQELGFSIGSKNDIYLQACLYQAFPSLDTWTVFALTSSFAGTLHCLAALSIANNLARDSMRKWLVFVIVTSSGALQLFCGYVETYSLMAAFLTLTLAFLVRWNGYNTTWLIAAVCSAVVAFLLHPLAIFLCVPLISAIAFQIYTRSPENRIWTFLGTGLLTAASGVALYLYFASWEFSPMDFSLGRKAYGLFSINHLADVTNEFLLLIPVHGLLLSVLVVRPSEGSRQPTDRILLILTISVAAAFTTSFAIEPVLGRLDWDLLSVYAIPFAVLTGYVSSRHAPGYILFPFTIVVLFHLLPWIAINTNLPRSAAMIESMVETDSHHRGERNVILGIRLSNHGLHEAGARQYQKALQIDPENDLALLELGMYYYNRNNIQEGIPLLKRSIEAADKHTDTNFIYSLVSYHQGNREEAVFRCSMFLLDHPDHTRAQSLAKQMADREESSKPNRMMLQSALLYVQKEPLAAINLGSQLAMHYKDRNNVVKFVRKIYEKIEWRYQVR